MTADLSPNTPRTPEKSNTSPAPCHDNGVAAAVLCTNTTHAPMRTLLLLALPLATPALAQLPNGGFEETVTTPQEVTWPLNWTLGLEFGAGLVGDAHSGNYALSVWNWYWYAEGKAANGTGWVSGTEGTPVSGHPTQLTGWYKREQGQLEPGEENDAIVNVLLTRWDPVAHARDTVAMGTRLFGEQAVWTPFTVEIGYLSAEAPDTVVVLLHSCGNCMCSVENQDGNCAYFTVDDLALSFTTGVSEALRPAPAVQLLAQADGTVRVDVAEGTPLPMHLQVFDARGRAVAEVPVLRNGQVLALAQAYGLLAYRATANGRAVGAGKVVVQ